MDNKNILFFMALLTIGQALALTVGSNTTFSRQPFITFPAPDVDNNMLGFAVFEKGFALADQTTTCIYNDFFPISGPVFLRGGALILNQDLKATNTFAMQTGGSFVGNGYSFELEKAPNDFFFPSVTAPAGANFLFQDTVLVLNNNIVFTRPISFWGECRINGRGSELTIQSGASIRVNPGAELIIENVILNGLQNSNLICLDDFGSIVLRSSTINLANTFTFTQGSILFQEDVVITGTGKFVFSADTPSVIASSSTLLLDTGITFSYDPSVASGNLLLMTDLSSQLYLNGCTLHSTRTGLQLNGGTLLFDNKITLSSEARNSAEALTLKSGLNIQVLGGANVQLFGLIKYDV